jgi:DNA-binding SARP family transcriptional activator
MLEGWLEHLPEKTVQDNPWLLFWFGACRMPFDPVGSRIHTERAFEQFWKRKDPVGTFLSWSLIIDNLCMYLNDFKALDEWIDRLDRITERFPSFPSPEIEARAVASLLGGLYMRRVDHPDIETWVSKASAMIRDCKEIPVRLQVSLYLFLYFIWIGDFPRARDIVEATRQWIHSSASYPQRRILFHLFEARWHCGVAQFDDSIRSAAKGLEIARTSGMHLWDFLFFCEGASASLGKGELGSASAYLRQMAPFLGTGQTLNHAYFHHLSSWQAALKGDIPLALSLEETADALVTDCGAPCGIALGYVYRARLENEIGNAEGASGHLEKAFRIARGMRSPILDFQCYLVEADIAFLRGDEESGLASLGKALSIGREKGYFHYDNWIPSFMTRLCVKALEKGMEVPYVQELIRRRNLIPESPPLDVETWPWPVRIYTLGRFGILKDGKPLTFSRKVQKRPLSLLKVLIALGGRAVREEQIADAVWPESEGDMAIQSMSVALRRLRQLLGQEEAVQRREGILSLDPWICWVDAFAFERLLGKGLSMGETGRKKGAAEREEKALALYRGPFLAEDAERSWAVSMRERLRSRYLSTVGRLGARWRLEGQWEKARECYQKGIDVDNLAEEFYQSLMSCYLADGRKAEALAVYDRLEKTFSSLGVEPSPKTRDLLDSLHSS